MNKGLLVVVSGPSAVGKNTVLSQFLVRYPNSRYSISATTRKPRPGEIPGKNYYFYSREQFQSLLEQNQFLEWAKVYDEYYGTPLAPILEGLESGQVIVMDLDVQGALQVKRRLPEAVLVFLLPPSIAALKARLIKRGTESAQDMDKRLEACQEVEEEQAQAFLKTVREHFPDCEVELYYGGQPLYYYIMSIE